MKFKYLPLLAILVSPASFAANLITNGDFETGDFSGWTQSGNTDFTGVDSDSAQSGIFGAFAGPVDTLGFIDQNISTVAGQSYQLTYWLANLGDTPNEFGVLIDNILVASSHLVDSNPFGYTLFSNLFTATAATTNIKFEWRHDPDYWNLDNVSVESAVPEPTSIALITSGLIGFGVSRRKRNQA